MSAIPSNYSGVRFNLHYAIKGLVHYVNQERTKAKTYFGGIRVNYENGSVIDTMPYEFEIPCYSLFICPFTNNALKATYVLNKANPDHRLIHHTIISEAIEDMNFIGLETYDKFYLITDTKCETMAYTYKPALDTRYETRNTDSDKVEDMLLFKSKSELVRYIFNAVERWGSVSGLQFCNLNVIPDEVLENIGCIKIPDVVGNSQPLWMACLNRLTNPQGLTATWRVEVKDELLQNAHNLINNFRQYIESAAA